MQFRPRKAPDDPESFLPVADLLRCTSKLTGYTGGPVVSLLRERIPNGLPMFQARLEGQSGWVWVAYIDLFCAFLSHRRFMAGRPARDKVRKALRPEWVRSVTFPSQRTRALTEALASGGAGVEWRKP